jgi:hypothetical protein
MSKNLLVQVLAVIVGVLALVGSSLVAPVVNEQRVVLQLTTVQTSSAAVPPDVALLSAVLGPFRGLAVDVLWYRANQRKEQGKYFEANQLSQWITKLQPRFAQVWAFHAWNMAYNISVATHTPDERWDWVNKGIALLRDEGIPNNPRSIRLYRELGWIFFHKLGQSSDEMHWYYKRRMAEEWHAIAGTSADGNTTKQVLEAFKLIVDAPLNESELVEKDPASAALLKKLRDALPEKDLEILRSAVRLKSYADSLGGDPEPKVMRLLLTNAGQKYPEEFDKLTRDPKNAETLAKLLSYLRRRAIVWDYHMDPALMYEYMELFGPLDWRHPSAHGLYWANTGTRVADELLNRKNIDLLNTYRQNVHSIQDMMRMGRMVFDPITLHLDLLPDPRFAPKYEVALNFARQSLDKQPGLNKDQVENAYAAGFENFLHQAITFSYLYGDEEMAIEYFKKARKLYGKSNPMARVYGSVYDRTLQEFVFAQFQGNADMSSVNRQFIDAMLQRAFTQGLANSRPDVFNRFVEMAKMAYERQEKKGVAAPNAEQRRMSFLPFPELVATTYESYISTPGIPVDFRARVWAATPVDLKQVVYDKAILKLKPQFADGRFDISRAFPEPPGMEAYRKAHPVAITNTGRDVNRDVKGSIERN